MRLPFTLFVLFLTSFSALFAQQINLFPGIQIKGDPYYTLFEESNDGNYLMASLIDHVNGQPTGNLIKIDSLGNVVSSFNKVITNDYVLKTATLPDGKILIAGWFTKINGVSWPFVARLQEDGTLDDTFQKFDISEYDFVSSLTVQDDGKIIVVGYFSKDGYDDIIRLHADGTTDETFTPLASRPLVGFLNVLIDGVGNIYTADAYGVYKFDSNGAPQNGFPVFVNSGGFFFSLERYENNVVIGGQFSSVNNVSRKNLAVINGDGTINSFSLLNAPSNIEALNVTDDGRFVMHDLNRVRIYTVNGSSFSYIASGGPQKIIVDSNNRILVTGGCELMAYNTPHPYTVRFKNDLSVDDSFVCSPTYTGGITAITSHYDGRILVAGDYTFQGVNESSQKLERINQDGTYDNLFKPAISPSEMIYSLATQPDGKILIGSNRLIRLNSSGSRDFTFEEKTLIGEIPYLYRVKLQGNQIFASGSFNKLNNDTSPGIIKLNSDGTKDPSFVSPLPAGSFVADFDFQSDGKIVVVVGGSWFNSTPQTVIRLLPTGELDPSFTPGSNSSNGVWHIRIDSADQIYLSGDFMDFNETERSKLIRLSPDGVLDETFTPSPFYNSVGGGGVHAMEILSMNELTAGLDYLSPSAPTGLVAIDASGNYLDRPYTQLGSGSVLSGSYFDGATLYFRGRLKTSDNVSVSGFASVAIKSVEGQVSDFIVVRTSATDASLSWENQIENGSLFIIERSVSNNQSFTPIDSIVASSNSYIDTMSDPDFNYFYRIRAINSNSSTEYLDTTSLEALVRQEQFIEFDELENKMVGDAPFQLEAVSTSELPVKFISSNTTIATINGNMLTIHKAGTITVTANQEGDLTYDNAEAVERSLIINKGIQTITFWDIEEKTEEDDPFALAVSASSALPVHIISSNEAIATVSNLTVTIHQAGEVTLTATQPGNEDYEPALPVEKTILISIITGREEEIQKNTLILYPNPGKGQFLVSLPNQFEGGRCVVTSVDGVIVYQQLVTLHEGIMTLDMTGFKSGLYIIKFNQGMHSAWLKAVKN